MITLYSGGTPNVAKVLLMLCETGLAFGLHPVDVTAEQQFAPEFVALNPNSKIPVIVDSDGPGGAPHTVFESGAILLYLAEKTGQFLPSEAAARSRVMQWLMFQMASIGPMFGQALHFRYAATGCNEGANDYAVHRYLTEVKRQYGVLERRLSAGAFLGDDYSIADMAAYPWVGRYAKQLGVSLDDYPGVAAWVARLRERPEVARCDALVKDILRSTRDSLKMAQPDSLDRFYGRGRYRTA